MNLSELIKSAELKNKLESSSFYVIFILFLVSFMSWQSVCGQDKTLDVKSVQQQILQEIIEENINSKSGEVAAPASNAKKERIELGKYWIADMNNDGEADLIQTFYHKTSTGNFKFFWVGIMKNEEVVYSDRINVGVTNYRFMKKSMKIDSISSGVIFTTLTNSNGTSKYNFTLLDDRLIRKDYINTPQHLRIMKGLFLQPNSQEIAMNYVFDLSVKETKTLSEGKLTASLDGNVAGDFIFTRDLKKKLSSSQNIKPIYLKTLNLFMTNLHKEERNKIKIIYDLVNELPDLDFMYDGNSGGHGLSVTPSDSKKVSLMYTPYPGSITIRTY